MKKSPRCPKSNEVNDNVKINEKCIKTSKKNIKGSSCVPQEKPPYVLEGNTNLLGHTTPLNEIKEDFFDEKLHSEKNFFKLNKKGEQRDYCFTVFPDINNMPNFEELGNHKQVRYLIFGEEYTPTTNVLHYQCYIYFHNNKSFSATKKILFQCLKVHCNFRKCRGSHKQNIAYCSKDEKYKEFGDEPEQGARTDFEAVHNELIQGLTNIRQIILTKPMIYHQFSKVLHATEDALKYDRTLRRNWMTLGEWHYGAAGQGKSYLLQLREEKEPNNWFIADNDVYKKEWWNGYTNQENVLLDEFRGQISDSELLTLVNTVKHCVPIRGTERIPFLAKTVFITTCMEPKEVYPKFGGKWDQFARRFKIYYYFGFNKYTEVKMNDYGDIIKSKMLQKIEKLLKSKDTTDDEIDKKNLKYTFSIFKNLKYYKKYNIKNINPLDII